METKKQSGCVCSFWLNQSFSLACCSMESFSSSWYWITLTNTYYLCGIFQDVIFSPSPRGKISGYRLSAFALHLLEQGIVYVVDSGFSIQRFYNPVNHLLLFAMSKTYRLFASFSCVMIFTNLVCYSIQITNIENIVVAPISKASAGHRAGSAGRVRPRKCYRYYQGLYMYIELNVSLLVMCINSAMSNKHFFKYV